MTTPAPAPPAPWFASSVVYQVYPRSFADSDGDGIGDLPGITARLDHLVDLGVDVVWLSPVYASPQDDNGYDISDYQAIDPSFGTLDDMDALLSAAHERGLKIVMDLVVNHTSDEHPWFVRSRDEGPDGPMRDWYVWRPPREGTTAGQPGAEPTNWRSSFSGSAWTLDETSGEYYLHLFSRKQPDLNWENPQVRAAVAAMMRWWLDRGVDGFRMDVINFISKRYAADGSLPDAPVTGDGPFGDGMSSYAGGPRLHEFLAELRREVFTGRAGDLLTVGEMPAVTVEEAAALTDGAATGGSGVVDMVFQFEHVDLDHGPGGKWDPRPLDLRDLKASLGRWQQGLAERGWNSLYWENHDQPRIVSRWGDDGRWWRESATALATVLHLHRGTPYVYQGEEIGMTNLPFERPGDFSDIEAVNHLREVTAADPAVAADPSALVARMARLTRDNARSGVQWDDGPHGGFTTGDPWFRVNANAATINVAAQRDDPTSVLSHYRALIALRRAEPCVAVGDFTMLVAEHPAVYAFTRTTADTALLVLASFSGGEEQSLDDVAAELGGDAAVWDAAELVVGNWHDGSPVTGLAPLRPWEARVLRRPLPRPGPSPTR